MIHVKHRVPFMGEFWIHVKQIEKKSCTQGFNWKLARRCNQEFAKP